MECIKKRNYFELGMFYIIELLINEDFSSFDWFVFIMYNLLFFENDLSLLCNQTRNTGRFYNKNYMVPNKA